MCDRNPHDTHLPKGQVVAGVAVVIGLAVSVGLLLAGDGPDMRTLAAAAVASAASCSLWSLPLVAI